MFSIYPIISHPVVKGLGVPCVAGLPDSPVPPWGPRLCRWQTEKCWKWIGGRMVFWWCYIYILIFCKVLSVLWWFWRFHDGFIRFHDGFEGFMMVLKVSWWFYEGVWWFWRFDEGFIRFYDSSMICYCLFIMICDCLWSLDKLYVYSSHVLTSIAAAGHRPSSTSRGGFIVAEVPQHFQYI